MKRVLFLAAVAACGPVRVDLDAGSVPQGLDVSGVQASLDEAIDYWKGCGWPIERGAGDVAVRFQDLRLDYFAYATYHDHVVKVQPWGEDAWVLPGEECNDRMVLASVLKHELGHALGLGHEPEEDAVMNASLAPCQVVTRDEQCPREKE